MNQYITGTMIRELREKSHMTQAELAGRLHVSDKTISKWETGRGYPDISMIEPIAGIFHVSVAELLSGNAISNRNTSGNMLRSRFYVCPVCGNVILSSGEAAISCHGILLKPEEAEDPDASHLPEVEIVEDEYYVTFSHEMTKTHFISFIAAVSSDGLQLKKLYPEWTAEGRFKINGVQKILYFCNRDGLFRIDPRKK